MNQNDPVKYILFMNLDWVTINGVRTWTKALILEEGPSLFGEVRRALRGLGTDPAWPVFDIFVPSIEYTLEHAQSNSMIMSDATPKGRPMATGAIMQLKDGPEVQLVVRDHTKPLDVHTFEGTWGDSETTDKLWSRLSDLAPKYWNAPYMPQLAWGPTPGFKGYDR